jgi:hypothetical protein
MQCSSVDLPDPDGPMIAVNLPTRGRRRHEVDELVGLLACW